MVQSDSSWAFSKSLLLHLQINSPKSHVLVVSFQVYGPRNLENLQDCTEHSQNPETACQSQDCAAKLETAQHVCAIHECNKQAELTNGKELRAIHYSEALNGGTPQVWRFCTHTQTEGKGVSPSW